jgi:hypothetical protein
MSLRIASFRENIPLLYIPLAPTPEQHGVFLSLYPGCLRFLNDPIQNHSLFANTAVNLYQYWAQNKQNKLKNNKILDGDGLSSLTKKTQKRALNY